MVECDEKPHGFDRETGHLWRAVKQSRVRSTTAIPPPRPTYALPSFGWQAVKSLWPAVAGFLLMVEYDEKPHGFDRETGRPWRAVKQSRVRSTKAIPPPRHKKTGTYTIVA